MTAEPSISAQHTAALHAIAEAIETAGRALADAVRTGEGQEALQDAQNGPQDSATGVPEGDGASEGGNGAVVGARKTEACWDRTEGCCMTDAFERGARPKRLAWPLRLYVAVRHWWRYDRPGLPTTTYRWTTRRPE